MHAFLAITLTLFFVIDALGNIPAYLSLIKHRSPKQQRQIALRELFAALFIMLAFQYLGKGLIMVLHVSAHTVQIAGGIILFLISIRLIFSDEDKTTWKDQEPFIVPIATPLIAGPSVFAVVTIFAQDVSSDLLLGSAIVVAWLFSSIIFYFAKPIHKLMKDKALNAAQRLMGLIVALVAVQLFLEGIKGMIKL